MALPDTIPFVGLRWDDALFLTLAAILIGSAILVVTMRDIIRCGLAMIVCFAALAGIYVLAGAPVVAAAQVLVYIGAISVLVLFAIMLTQTKAAPTRLVFQTQAIPAGVAAFILAIIVALAATATDWQESTVRLWTRTSIPRDVPVPPGTRGVAETLFSSFVLPFEVVGVLLLAAVVGGIFLAKRDRVETD